MSNVVNTEGRQPGCIHRIALENFVTYRQVVLYPGPSLNMIIGPNGTGKSTFVCGIILGLCGKTNVIGRAKKISEYVRSGCEQATIEIELYREMGERNVIITRSFNLKCSSTWLINHKIVSEKQVQDLIESLNIQVDNLCQLLPQDRVQDFSKMDPPQLLRSTLAAVGGRGAVEQLDQLVESRGKQREQGARLKSNVQLLQEQVRLNESLKVVIDAMQQRKEIVEQIEICEKKRLWLEYQELREKVIECTHDKKESEKLVASHTSRMQPLVDAIPQAKANIGRLEQQKLAASREVHTLTDKVKETLATVMTHHRRIGDLESSFQNKLERHGNRERELAEARAKLDKLRTDAARLKENVGSAEQIKMQQMELRKPIAVTNAAIEKMKTKYDLDMNVIPQIRLYQNKISQLEDVGKKRLRMLRQMSEDCARAVTWYRENAHQFQEASCEPMLLQINFTDPKYARYLETMIAIRDLLAFTFESTQDMNLFLRTMRSELGLRTVNADCSPKSNELFKPPVPLDQISYLGFHTYLVDTITAPAPIIRYLCRQYNIHQIPIGNQYTYNNSAEVPNNIRYFFSENHRFTVRVSRYSGEMCSSIIEVPPSKILANSVDVEQLNNFNNQLAGFQSQADSHQQKTEELERKLSTLKNDLNELNTRRQHINEGVDKVKEIIVQIRLQKSKVENLKNEPALDMQREKIQMLRKQRECVLKQGNLHRDTNELMKALQNKLLNGEMWKVKLELSRKVLVKQETELSWLKDELKNVQATLNNIEILLNRAKSTAKQKLLEAKRASGDKLPQDPEFPYKRAFDALPSQLNALQAHCIDLQTRIDCMDRGDKQVIEEYEARKKTIQKLRYEVDNSSALNKQLEDKMNEIKEAWLPSLEKLIRDIDVSFGAMFENLGCAGEIKLDKAGSDDDYDKYGIGILVRFRENEQLQQLTRHAQSGGERALSTALYLMSLQRLTTVPFRCVDEINQGMDPINERKMYQLLVKVTTEWDSGQYFLLTPKLLTGLVYNDKIKVHTIMNGKSIIDHKKWDLSKFVPRAKDDMTQKIIDDMLEFSFEDKEGLREVSPPKPSPPGGYAEAIMGRQSMAHSPPNMQLGPHQPKPLPPAIPMPPSQSQYPSLGLGAPLAMPGSPSPALAGAAPLPVFANGMSVATPVAPSSLFMQNGGNIPMPPSSELHRQPQVGPGLYPLHGLPSPSGSYATSLYGNMLHSPSLQPPAGSSIADQWYYEDPAKTVQGPFSSKDMYGWYRSGFFTSSLMVRRACEPTMRPLGSYGPIVPFTVRCTYITIEESDNPVNSVILSKPAWMWGAEMGANSKSVVIGNEAVWTNNTDCAGDVTTKRLLGMDLLRLGLERGNTAEESLDVITTLLEKYGQGGPCSETGDGLYYHNSFLIADPKGAWVLETSGKLWAAEKVDGYRNISNGLTIGTQIDKCSKDLQEAARFLGFWDGQSTFNFTRCFSSGGDEDRQLAGARLLRELSDARTFHVPDMMRVLRDRDSGICRGCDDSFPTQGSQVSSLSHDGLSVHWLTATPDPSVSCFKPFVFTAQPAVSADTRSPDTATREHRLYSLHWKRCIQARDARVIAAQQRIEKQRLDDVERLVSGDTSGAGLDRLMADSVEMEMKIYE